MLGYAREIGDIPMDNAQKVYTMLSFQYKPLEDRLLADLAHSGNSEAVRQYRRASYAKKIAILDTYAAFLGL